MSLLGALTHTQKCSIRDMEKISNKFHQEAPTTSTIFLLQIVQQTVGNEEYFFLQYIFFVFLFLQARHQNLKKLAQNFFKF